MSLLVSSYAKDMQLLHPKVGHYQTSVGLYFPDRLLIVERLPVFEVFLSQLLK